MDIGTAKIQEEEKRGIPHHLIDIRDLSERFSVMEFYNELTDHHSSELYSLKLKE